MTSFCSSPLNDTQSSYDQTTKLHSLPSPNSPPSYSFVTSTTTGSTNSAQQLHVDQVSPNYYDTFVTSCEDSPPPEGASQSRDPSQEPYDYTRSTRFFLEDSGVSGGEGSADLMTDSDPSSPIPGRFSQMYNSTESDLVSDGEDAGESTELLPLGGGASSRTPSSVPTRQKPHIKVHRPSSGRSPTSPISPIGAGTLLSTGEGPAGTSGRARDKYRRRPESQPLLMRPEVLKLRKTTC